MRDKKDEDRSILRGRLLPPEPEFWTQLMANGGHTEFQDVLDIFYGCKNLRLGVNGNPGCTG